MNRIYTCLYTTALLFLTFSAAEATPRRQTLPGPVPITVLDVLDGDTVAVKAHVWIGEEIEISVRIDGIDAPEIKGQCEKERTMAEAARQEIISLLSDGKAHIYNIRLEKYAGRVLAGIQTGDGIDIGKHMIEKGLVKPYHGEKRRPWCPDFS